MADEAQGLTALLEEGARLYAGGNSAAAAQVYRRALEVAPGDPTGRLRLALAIWHGENRGAEALAELRALEAEYPQPAVFGAKATVLNSLGRFAEAAEAARRAVAEVPEMGGAWVDLATAVDGAGAAAALGELDAALKGQRVEGPALRQINLARARLLRKLGRADEAFEAMAASNALAPQRWNEEWEKKFADGLRAVFTGQQMQRLRGTGHADGRMIFIVGMPRSGTTLLERLLLAHPDVASAGETPIIGSLHSQLAAQSGAGGIAEKLSSEVLRSMGTAYLQGVAARASEALRVIDKMPANYLFVPLIRLMFPRATILHMRRHPLDIGLSCWEAGFTFGQDFATRFETMGAAYRLYAGLLRDWEGLPGARVQSLRYEDLVTRTEAVMEAVLSACRLPWDSACLRPAEEGQIKTASLTQARAPVSDRSVGRWRAFEDRLAPLIRAMGGMDWIEAEAGLT